MIPALALAAFAACGSPTPAPMTLEQMIAADPIPLAKGAKWTYDVTYRRMDGGKETTRQATWTTEVLDERSANGIVAYRVRGWPTDLADLDADTPNPTPTERTILRHGNAFLYGASAEPTIDGAEGWFSWPVMDGQRICPSHEVTYCWVVEAIDGGYRLKYNTGPDEEVFDLAPGQGVSRFHYAHHGLTNEVEARLTSFSKGR